MTRETNRGFDVESLIRGVSSSNGIVCVLGSMNADYTVTTERLPLPGETVPGGPIALLPGGKSGNQAASAARIGANVRMFGALGRDENADFLAGKLMEAGVDVSHVARLEGASGSTLITVDAAGENTIVYSAGSNALLSPSYIDSVQCDLTEGAVLGLCLESPMDAVVEAATICHSAGMTVLLNDSPFTASLPTDLIEACDVLLVNEHEITQLLGAEKLAGVDTDWHEISYRMAEIGFEREIITLGSAGSVVIDSGEIEHVDPVTVKAIDMTGCGDAYMGAILAGLVAGYNLGDSAHMASAVSAFAATGRGAQSSYGSGDQVIDALRGGFSV